MKEGAVAMIDALGFRGIWDRWPPDQVLTNMHAMKDSLEEGLKDIATQPDMQFEATFLSDTVVIGLALPPSLPNHDALSLIYVTDIVTRVLTRSARSSTPLAYRGAVAYGEYEISSNFILGRAIDEAADNHESAQGAIVWLLPRAPGILSLVGLRSNRETRTSCDTEFPSRAGTRSRPTPCRPSYKWQTMSMLASSSRRSSPRSRQRTLTSQ